MKLNLATLKNEAEFLLTSNPQKGALINRALTKIEEGVQLLAAQGYSLDQCVEDDVHVPTAASSHVPSSIEEANLLVDGRVMPAEPQPSPADSLLIPGQPEAIPDTKDTSPGTPKMVGNGPSAVEAPSAPGATNVKDTLDVVGP